MAQGVVLTGLARPSLGGLSGCESSRGEGGCSCPSGIRRGWAIGLAAAATDHTPPARHAGRRGHGGSGAAPASGPLRPAPGPAPPESPRGNPLHALPRPPHRRNEDDSHPHHTGQQPATPPPGSAHHRTTHSPGHRHPQGLRAAQNPEGGRGQRRRWGVRRAVKERGYKRMPPAGALRLRDGRGAVRECRPERGERRGWLPSRPPSTQAEPSSRGPGRQGRSYSGALHLDALNHDRSTVCGSKADGMGAG